MICELCKADSTARFCAACVAKLSALLQAKPKAASAPVLRTRREELDNKLTHYRVQVEGFCCYVDMRDCPNMDEVLAYALNRGNREPWYPTTQSTPLEIPFVTAVTHSQFCDWLQLKEA